MTLREAVEKLRTGQWRDVARLIEIRPGLQSIPYLLAGAVVGLGAVLYSTAFGGAIVAAQTLVQAHPWLFLAWAPICFVVSSWLPARFAPAAGGSGVPIVMDALQREAVEVSAEKVGALINPRIAGITILSSVVCILGGGGLGREGPMVIIAACVFYFVGNQFRRIWPHADHRSWLIAGAAAGVAAAFQTPLAGVVFVLEELAHEHYHAFKSYVLSAVVVAGMIAQWLFGRYLFLGYAKIGEVPVSAVAWTTLVGLLCGSIAVLFETVIQRLRKRTGSFFMGHRLGMAATLGVVTALIAAYDPRTVGGGIATVQELLFTDGARASWELVGVRFLGPIVAHLAGCAGGFLAPSLALGAAVGSKFATLVGSPHHNLLVMAGMVAFLGAINRAPFTALVIVMEMTDSHAAIFPLMVSAVLGYGAVSLFGKEHGK